MEGVKSALTSKAVWGGIIAVGAGLAGLIGYQIAPTDQANLVDLLTSIAAGIGGVVAIVGRIVATKRIG